MFDKFKLAINSKRHYQSIFITFALNLVNPYAKLKCILFHQLKKIKNKHPSYTYNDIFTD